MPILTVDGMISVEKANKARAEALNALISKPFNINDEGQLSSIKRYSDLFEINLNQMQIFQGLSTGLTRWWGFWFVGSFLPIPDLVKQFLNLFLFAGVTGYILEQRTVTDFYVQLDELKTIYNWCTKKGRARYDGVSDNSDILLNRDIQRLIKLIAPLCTIDFMLAWKKSSEQEAPPQSTIWNPVSAAYSYFSTPKSTADLNSLQAFKNSVEKREFDVDVIQGAHNALEYFFTNPRFRELLVSAISQPIKKAKDLLPSVVSGITSGTRSQSGM